MMLILIAPGAFKNSLTARQAAEAIERGLRRSGLQADLRLLPAADGGNGTLNAFLVNGGEQVEVTVEDPFGKPISSAFGLINNGHTAVIEMALASGLELITSLDPMTASTYGTGQLIKRALERGAKKLIIGMGGSATVDGGAGALEALGVKLLDSEGNPIPRGGGGLAQLAQVDPSALDKHWQEVEIVYATDVDNPAVGLDGAAAVFAPQKGATPEQVERLEANLQHFFSTITIQTGVDVRTVPGSGAAGALSGGLMSFLGGRIESGIDLLLHHNGFEERLKGASLIVTGEGRLDSQSVRGKTPLGIARRAQAAGVPVVAIVGSLAIEDEELHKAGIHAAMPITTEPMSLEKAITSADTLVEKAALRLGYLLQLQL
jgi:glycerate 2-kinase